MEVIRVAYVEFNERLSDWPAISEVGNEAFGMWIRCLIYIAWWDTPNWEVGSTFKPAWRDRIE
jgi:hypothetical protein